MALDPLKFQVAIQDEATGQLNKIEQEFDKLKDKTISVKVEGLSDLQQLLSALQHQQISSLGKDVGSAINEASRNLQKEAQEAVRTSLGNLAQDLVAIKEAIQHDNFTAFSTRITKCAEAVNKIDEAFKKFHVTIGQDDGMRNFMTGLGEVIRNVRTTMGVLNGGGSGNTATPDAMSRSVKVARHEMERLNNDLVRAQRNIETFGDKGFNVSALERYKTALVEVRENLRLIERNGGVHPITGLTASQYLSSEDASRVVSLLKTELSYYNNIRNELERIAKLRSTLSSVLSANPSTTFRSDLANAIAGLDFREGLLARQGSRDAMQTLNSEAYRQQIADAVNLISKVSSESRQAEKDNTHLVESMRKAGIAVSDLAAKFDKLEISKIRAKAVDAKVDTSAYDKAVERMERYQKVLDYIHNHGGHDASRITGSVGYRNASNDLNVQAAALKTLTADAKRAEGALNQLTAEEQRLTQSMKSTTESARSQSQVLSDLKSMATQYLGVWGGQQFLNNIIQIGGQLEMQRLSIGAILGDAAQANDLFEKIKGLAIQSPFGVVELDQMTKQLTAYGFEYNELFDMTKRLADISAATGTGVDRLALALGHVRSEAALSGYTLRQFSMANIPLAQKLSERLSEIEHRFVSIADVRKRVRSKEIGYEDVVAVLKEMTDEGGMFYRAQETMSQSVKARFKNLKDSMDIMYGEMAESKVGDGLKEVAITLTNLTRNWEELAAAIATVTALYGGKKLIEFLNANAINAYSSSITRLGMNLGSLTATELRELAYSGQLSKQRLLEAVATGQVSVEDAKLAAAKWGLNNAQLAQVASGQRTIASLAANSIATSKYSVAQLRAIATTRSFVFGSKSLAVSMNVVATNAKIAGTALLNFMKAAWPVALITAGVEAWMHYRKQSEQAAEAAGNAFTRGAESVRNLKDALENLPKYEVINGESNLDEGSLRNGIKNAAKELKNYHVLANDIIAKVNMTDDNGKPIMSLAEQYMYLRNQVELAKQAMEEYQRTSSAQESALNATGGIVNDNALEDINDYFSSRNAFIEKTNAFVEKYKNQAKVAIDAAREEDEAFRKQTEGMTNYAEMLRILVTETDSLGNKMDFSKGFNVFWGMHNMQSTNFKILWNGVGGQFNEAKKELDNWATGFRAAMEGSFGYDFSHLTEVQLENIRRHIWDFSNSPELSKLDEQTRKWIRDYLGRKWNITFSTNVETVLKDFDEMQNHIEKLVGKEWVIKLNLQSVGSFEELYDTLDKDVKEAKETIKKLGTSFTKERKKQLESDVIDDTQLSGKEKEYRDAYNKFRKAKAASDQEGFELSSLKEKTSDRSGSKPEDKDARRLREIVKLYKDAYDWYGKYEKQVGEGSALAKVKEQFEPLFKQFEEQFKQKLSLDSIPLYKDNLVSLLDEAQKLYESPIHKNSYMVEAIKTIRDAINNVDYEEAQRKMDEYASKVQTELDGLTNAWDIFNNVREATGDISLAVQLSGADYKAGQTRNLADALRDKIEKDFASANAVAIPFDINMSDKDIENQIKAAIPEGSKDRIKGIVEEYKKWRDLQREVLEDDINVFSKAYHNEYDTKEELDIIIARFEKEKTSLDRLLKQFQNGEVDGNGSRRGIDASQYERALRNLVSERNWNQFKANNDFTWVFDNIGTTNLDTIRKMIQAMRDYAQTTEMSEEVTKAWLEAIDKLTDQETVLDPLKSIADSAKVYTDAVSKRKLAENNLRIAKMSRAERKREGIDESEVLSVEEATKRLNRALSDEEKALLPVTRAIQSFAGKIGELGTALSNLGNSIGGDFGDIMNGVGGMINDLSNGVNSTTKLVEAMKTKGFSGAIGKVTAAVSIISSIVDFTQKLDSLLPSNESIYKKYAEKQRKINELQEQIVDYQIAALKRQLEATNWLYTNGLSELRNQGYVKKNLLKEYANSMLRPQEIYQEARSGFSKWGPAIIGAIVAVVGAVVTIGLGSLGSAAIGSAIAAGALGNATAAIGAALAAGAGAAIGTVIRSAADQFTYDSNQTSARNNMRVQTRHKTFFRGEKTQNLEDWVRENYGKELFDKNHYDLIDIELAKQILEDGPTLVGETKDTLERLVEYAEQIREIEDNVHEYVSQMFSPLVDNMVDSLWDWLSDGKDMLDSFKDYASDTFRDIAKDAVKSFLKINLIDKYQDKLSEIFTAYSLGAYNEQEMGLAVASVGGEIRDSYQALIPALETLGTSLADAFKIQGYDIVNGDNGKSSSYSSTIKGITEQKADLIASYLNATRADVSVNRAMIAQYFPMYYNALTSGNENLRGIENHTDAIMRSNNVIAEKISSLENMVTGLKNKTWKVPIA